MDFRNYVDPVFQIILGIIGISIIAGFVLGAVVF